MMLFSATYDTDVMNFAENVISNPVVSIKFKKKLKHLTQLSLRHFKCNELHGTYDIYFLNANDIYKGIVWLKMWLVGT